MKNYITLNTFIILSLLIYALERFPGAHFRDPSDHFLVIASTLKFQPTQSTPSYSSTNSTSSNPFVPAITLTNLKMVLFNITFLAKSRIFLFDNQVEPKLIYIYCNYFISLDWSNQCLMNGQKKKILQSFNKS